jgi:Spy/CpxP family protein refolding chaperone
MNTQNETKKRRWPIVAALALAAATIGGVALGGQAMPGHHGHKAMNPAQMEAHIDKMIEQCAPDASADQRSRLHAIAKAAMADVRAAHEQLAQGHRQAHELLTAPVIDRAALEQLRAAQMQRLDAVSRRVLAAAEDGAEVLTPAQRASCGKQMGSHMH